ncbi:MAG: exodeoxyribonuclease VII large subunit [Phycisphaerales bacterium]
MPGGLFDPSKMRGSPPPDPSARTAAPDDALSVSALCQLITNALADRIPRTIRVVGEISGFRDRSHWYFDLKDESAVINCVMFAAAARGVSFPLENGLKVIAEGRVDFYPKQGKTQVYVNRLAPIGAGELELRYRALVEQLRALGWFNLARKKPLPAFPKRIAIVTSRTGAALQDVIDTARRRCPMVELALVDVRVQGEAAAPEIARALRSLSRHRAAHAIDAIILTRGGGSMEDLWAFNERIVAEAIVESRIPIVAAIGHETDTTIAELVADERCATPTQAAMRLIPDRAALLEQCDAQAARMSTELRRRLRYEAQRLRAAARLPWFTDPRAIIDAHRAQAASLHRRLGAAIRHRLQRQRADLSDHAIRIARGRPEAVYATRIARLDTIGARLVRALRDRLSQQPIHAAHERLSFAWQELAQRRRDRLDVLDRELRLTAPDAILRRGFSITTINTRLVRSTADAAPGDTLTTRLADGTLTSIITPSDESPAPSRPPDPPASSPDTPMPARPALRPARRSNTRTKPNERDQLRLF